MKRKKYHQPTLASVTRDVNRRNINNLRRFNNEREPTRIEIESRGDRVIRKE